MALGREKFIDSLARYLMELINGANERPFLSFNEELIRLNYISFHFLNYVKRYSLVIVPRIFI